MRRSAREDAGDLPFDLPLDPPQAVSRHSTTQLTQPELPLEPAPAQPPDLPGGLAAVAVGDEPPDPTRAIYGRRWAAGVLDLAVHLSVLASAVGGSWWLGVPLDQLSILPLVLFAICFSFVYHVVPLTFWGHTPGMASVGLLARDSHGGGPLTINQAVQRWLGAIVNVFSLGVIFLLRRGSSLSDLFSRSTVGGHD